jgi:hypothetical protein
MKIRTEERGKEEGRGVEGRRDKSRGKKIPTSLLQRKHY